MDCYFERDGDKLLETTDEDMDYAFKRAKEKLLEITDEDIDLCLKEILKTDGLTDYKNTEKMARNIMDIIQSEFKKPSVSFQNIKSECKHVVDESNKKVANDFDKIANSGVFTLEKLDRQFGILNSHIFL